MVVKLSLVPSLWPMHRSAEATAKDPMWPGEEWGGEVTIALWPGETGHTGHPPCRGERLIWRETEQVDWPRLLSRHLLRAHGEIKLGFNFKWETMENSSVSIGSIITSWNTHTRLNSEYIPVLPERNVLAPGVVAPVPLQWSMSGHRRIKNFYGDGERML